MISNFYPFVLCVSMSPVNAGELDRNLLLPGISMAGFAVLNLVPQTYYITSNDFCFMVKLQEIFKCLWLFSASKRILFDGSDKLYSLCDYCSYKKMILITFLSKLSLSSNHCDFLNKSALVLCETAPHIDWCNLLFLWISYRCPPTSTIMQRGGCQCWLLDPLALDPVDPITVGLHDVG